MKKITLISSAQLAYNPRLVKEADALHAAGFAVRVVAMDMDAARAQLDQSLMVGRGWQLEVVTARRNGAGHGLWRRAAFRQKLSSMLVQGVNTGGLRTLAYSRFAPELARLAAHEPADLFIAHNLPALPAAAQAARRWQAKLGYDAEDFQGGIRRFDAAPTLEDTLTARIEAEFLPQCQHLTAASPGVAAAIAGLAGGHRALPVLNVFPLAERPAAPPVRPPGGPLKLYWFSQVVGTDRGLADAVRAVALLPAGSVELHLRGQCDAAARRYLDELIARHGAATQAVTVHPPVPLRELVALTAQYDVGLALEEPISENRVICMHDLCTNKVFTYLLAGLALAATALSDEKPVYDGAGFVYPHGQPEKLAAGLRHWLEHPAALRAAQEKAWALGATRYNWDLEKEKLVAAVKNVLNV